MPKILSSVSLHWIQHAWIEFVQSVYYNDPLRHGWEFICSEYNPVLALTFFLPSYMWETLSTHNLSVRLAWISLSLNPSMCGWNHTLVELRVFVVLNQHRVWTLKLLLKKSLPLVVNSISDMKWPTLQPGSILHRSHNFIKCFLNTVWAQVLNGFISISMSVRNFGSQLLASYKRQLTYLHFLGSISGNAWHEEVMMIDSPVWNCWQQPSITGKKKKDTQVCFTLYEDTEPLPPSILRTTSEKLPLRCHWSEPRRKDLMSQQT